MLVTLVDVSSWLLIPDLLAFALSFVAMVMKAFALIDAATRRSDAFTATDHQSKVFWLVLLTAAVLVSLLFAGSPMSLFNIAAAAVAGVYLAGVRPALRDAVNRTRY